MCIRVEGNNVGLGIESFDRLVKAFVLILYCGWWSFIDRVGLEEWNDYLYFKKVNSGKIYDDEVWRKFWGGKMNLEVLVMF